LERDSLMRPVEDLLDKLEELDADGMLVTKIENVRYLTGFSGSSAFALVSGQTRSLLTDGRYKDQATSECTGWDVKIYTSNLFDSLGALLDGVARIAFEGSMSYEFHQRLEAVLPEGGRLIETRSLVEALRARKDPAEVALIEAALRCASVAFEQVRPMIIPGVTERDVAAELDYRMIKAGADMVAFDTVVASGPNSALPHAGITDRGIDEGDLVVVDFGARKDGYFSDVTRTLVAGDLVSKKQRAVIEAVTDAVEAAVSGVCAGAEASSVDALARGVLEERGLIDYFTHGTGHGIGRDVHELPSLSKSSADILEPVMIFSIEPGVYIEGWGGVRIEEMVMLTESGPVVMSSIIQR
jgi:Xaa-Pro aminopeptidase